MLIARSTFTAGYDGQRIEVVAGQTAVDPDHALAKEFPERFERYDDPRADARRDDVIDRVQRHTRNDRDGGRDRDRLPLKDELTLRAERLRELAAREHARTAPAAVAQDAFWARVARQLEDPRQAVEDRTGVALINQVDAARAQGVRDEIGALSAWLRG